MNFIDFRHFDIINNRSTLLADSSTHYFFAFINLFSSIIYQRLERYCNHRYQTFETLSKHLYLHDIKFRSNSLECSDLYHYRNLLIIWNDFTQDFVIIVYISKDFFLSKHFYFHIYFSIFVQLIFGVHLIIMKFYFQNIAFLQKSEIFI